MLKKILFVITIAIFLALLPSCSSPATRDMVDRTKLYAAISMETPTDRRYYFDEETNTLIYFAKDNDSGLYNLFFTYDGQEKEHILSFPSMPRSYVFDDGYIYFYSMTSFSPTIDPNYEEKQAKLKELSEFFGDSSYDSLFRANLETKEIQWLGSSYDYLLDDEHIYFMELPIDYDQYGLGSPKGCSVFHNSLCRMEKDGTNPILIRPETYGLNYITDKYIYTDEFRFDKGSLEAEALPDSEDAYKKNKAYTEDKVFYTKLTRNNDRPSFYSVYSDDRVTEKTTKIADYSPISTRVGTELIPLKDGGLIIWQSDSPVRDAYQVGKIHFFDKNHNLTKTMDANGRYNITVADDKVFYLLQEINDDKPLDSYKSGEAYATLTLCSDDLSMRGKNVTRIAVIDGSDLY